jgi:hypothetical protein
MAILPRRGFLLGGVGGLLALEPVGDALAQTEWRWPGSVPRRPQPGPLGPGSAPTVRSGSAGSAGSGQPSGATAGSNGGAAGAAPAAAAPPGYTLAFEDRFDRLDLLPPSGASRPWLPYWARWNVRHLAGNQDKAVKYGDAEVLADGRLVGEVLRASGRWGARTGYLHEVGGSTLKLRGFPLGADAGAFGGFPFVAAMLSGERVHAQRWGYWEIRLRVTRLGRGQHLAVWLLPSDGSWPPEIDIVEMVGQDPATFHTNAHGSPVGLASYRAPNGATGWHSFGFEWTPSVMRWFCEGRLVREQASYIADKELYLLVSWEIGSKWPGPTDASTPWPAEVELDHVRIHRRT